MLENLFADWGAPEWSALGTWVTAGIAAAAGLIALGQVKEARKTRQEQAQPYVVVYMEPSQGVPKIIDLVVRNFGKTTAYNVTMEISPYPKRSVQGGIEEDVWLFDWLPVLVPG
jgi:hypothetical protein